MSATTDIVKWGVLSTARIGRDHVIPAMQKGRLSRIEAVASRDLETARRFAEPLGIARAYGSYEELLADPAIEAIYNPLPNHLHVPLTIQAMEAGKHVLCEKPIALNTAEAEQLVAAQKRTGKLVAEAFMVRHAPWWRRARELVREGRLGEVRSIQTAFSFFLDDAENIRSKPEMGGGGIMDIGCYALTTARYIYEADPLRVASLVERDASWGVDRLASAVVEFPGHRHLTFTCSTHLAPHQRVTIMGTKARLEVLIPFNAPRDQPCRIVIDSGEALDGSQAVVESFPPTDQYTVQGDDFSAAVRGLAPLEFPIETAVANMKAIDAIFRAGDSGKWETI